MTTTTLRELRHNFPAVEESARRGPVRITRRGRVIGTFTASKNPAKSWPEKPDFPGRAIKTRGGPLDMLEFLDR